MAVWSSILRAAGQKCLQNGGFGTTLARNGQVRCMSEHRTMVIKPSNFQWHKAKDYVHFYFLLGLIPVGTIIFIVNVFIGPATLQEIPEDYVPKEWEYHQHPIKRFFARYFFPLPQQEYEKFLHHIYHESQVQKVRKLTRQVENAMAERRDYRGPFFREFYGSKYLYKYRESLDKGDNLTD